MHKNDEKFRQDLPENRQVQIEILSDELKSTIFTTSHVIFYFYRQQRLFHPNEVELIEIVEVDADYDMDGNPLVRITFQTEALAMLFFLKCAHKDAVQKKDFSVSHRPTQFNNANYFYRNASTLDCCVLQRPIHPLLDPSGERSTPRTISRCNRLCTMKFIHHKFVSFFVYNQHYSDPNNKRYPLHSLPPPIIERFDLGSHNVENYFIEENDDCIVIDFALSELPVFYQHGFIATDIKSDEERLNKKYDHEESKQNSFDAESSIEIQSQFNSNESDYDFDLNMLMDLREQQRISTAGGPEDIDLRYSKAEYEDEDYYEAIRAMEKQQQRHHKEDEDIVNDVHKSKKICPYVRYRDYCKKYRLSSDQCPYKYHPKMERNVDFGNNDLTWKNPNNHKITEMASARRAPKNIDEEFASYIHPHQEHNPLLYLHDIIHNCFILRVTLFKCGDAVRRRWYEERLTQRFQTPHWMKRQKRDYFIHTPQYCISEQKRDVTFPLMRTVNSKFVTDYVSPVSFCSSLKCADYRAAMKQFMQRLNANNGEYHLEAFCLMSCLINYPPIFIVEDFHASDYEKLEDDIKTDEKGKVWQVLKKLSEGNIKWEVLESSGKGGSGRGGKGDLDKHISKQTASCRERYCIRENRDNPDEGRNATFLEIYTDVYFNIDFLNHLKKQELGWSLNRFEWVKTLKITPLYYHLMVDQEKSCRMFRLKKHHHRSQITFLRVEFQSVKRSKRYGDAWQYGSFTRQQVQNILTLGMSIGGAKYDFFFFSDGQLRDVQCWMYSIQLSQSFNSIKALRNNMGDFEKIKNPGKKMSRMGLYNTKSTLLASLKLSEIEFIDDPLPLDGKEPLTDGCCIIDKDITKPQFSHGVVSMLSRLGGAKCMLMCLPSAWIADVIKRDQTYKREKLMKQIEKEKLKANAHKDHLDLLAVCLRENENRNFNAKAVITKSSKKFDFDKFNLEVAVKEASNSKGAFTNKEFIGAAYFHFYKKGEQHIFEQNLQKYARKWFTILNNARICLPEHPQIRRQCAEIFLNVDRHKGKWHYLLDDIDKVKNNRFGSGRRGRGRGRYNNKYNGFQAEYLTHKCGEAERCNRIVKECWAKAVDKLRILLPWPSVRIEGVADWTQTLHENEIFLKIEVPPTVCILCPMCLVLTIDPLKDRCSGQQCGGKRPTYYVYEGDCGLLKNPCLHPRSYKRFTAIRSDLLNNLFDGECLLFSTRTDCQTSPVFAMSGADLDGDDFLVVTQKDLLPLHDAEVGVEIQEFDAQGERKLPQYIDDDTIVDYFVEYALHENTAQLSQLHEAYSEHNIEGIGHRDCIEIAKYHSFALDFPKTGKAAVFPDDIGIPNMEDVQKFGHCIFPHYMHKIAKMKFHSTMIKGRFYDFVLSQVPMDLVHDQRFSKDAWLPRDNQNQLKDTPWLANGQQQQQPMKEQKHQEQKHGNNNNNNMNRNRHENIDNDEAFHWLDAAMHNGDDNNALESNDDDVESDWFKEVTFEELNENIQTKEVRDYLKDATKLNENEIKTLKDKLGLYLQTFGVEGAPGQAQCEAFHVDYYYTAVLEILKRERDEYDSDNVNENEDEKKSAESD